jgi:predicted DNA-binding transcriptional regulator AlpA
MKTRQKRTTNAIEGVSDSSVDDAAVAVPTPSPRRLERESEVCRRTGRHRSSLWRDVRSGLMPSPVRIGIRSVGWYADEIDDWISSRPRVRRSTDSE